MFDVSPARGAPAARAGSVTELFRAGATDFLRELPWQGVAKHTNGFVRSLRFEDERPVSFVMDDSVRLTIQTTREFHAVRKADRHFHSDAGSVGRVFMEAPGSRIGFSARGEFHALQMKMPRTVFDQILIEDHDEPGGIAAIRTINGETDFELMRLNARALLASGEVAEVYVRAMVARLIGAHGDSPKRIRTRGLSPVRLRRVRELVAADPAGVTLASMAEETGLSLFHFAREFKRETGQSPWDFVLQWRVWQAVRTFGTEVRTLDEIAQHLGFSHSSHMARSFRKVLGVAPSAIRGRLLPGLGRA